MKTSALFGLLLSTIGADAAFAQTLKDRPPIVPSLIHQESASPFSRSNFHQTSASRQRSTAPSTSSGWRSLAETQGAPVTTRRPAVKTVPWNRGRERPVRQAVHQRPIVASPARVSSPSTRLAQGSSSRNDGYSTAPYLAPNSDSQLPIGAPPTSAPAPADTQPSLTPFPSGPTPDAGLSGLSSGAIFAGGGDCQCAPAAAYSPIAQPVLQNYTVANPYTYANTNSFASRYGQPATVYRPVIAASYAAGPYYGSSLFGRAKVYVPGQPVRNFFRAVLP